MLVVAAGSCGQKNGQPGQGPPPPAGQAGAGGSGGDWGGRPPAGGGAGVGNGTSAPGSGGASGGSAGAATGGSPAGAPEGGGGTGTSGSGPDGSAGAPAGTDAPVPGGNPGDTAPGTPAVQPGVCKGTRGTTSVGGLTALRTDITARRLLSTPGNGTRLARDAKTGEFLMLLENGNVRRIDLQPDGSATSAALYSPAQIGMPGGSNAHGMSLGPDGTLYVVSHLSQSASGNTSRASIWKGVPAGNGARTWSKLAETASYPRSRTYYDHEWSGIVASPDGQYLYVNAGSRTDHGDVQTNGGAFPNTREVALTSGIFRFPSSASNLQLPNDDAALRAMGVVFARGVRNSFDSEFAPNGDPLAADNGPDADYHEELNWIREGHHYGFPWRLGNEDNQMQFPTYDADSDRRLQRGAGFSAIDGGSWRNDPGFPAKPQGVTFTDPILNAGPDGDRYRNPSSGAVEDASATSKPFATFTDHGSPLGLTFDRNEGALCADFAGGTFLLRFGKAAGATFDDPGRDLLHLRLARTGSDYGSAATTQLVRGFSGPVDAVLVADKMYILDWNLEGSGQGTLWEVTLPNGR